MTAKPRVSSRKRPRRGAKNASATRSGRKVNPPRTGENAARILDVALNLFARSSFWAVTIKDIGSATGLNTAMIYYYFRDKEDLFRATVEVSVRRAFGEFEARNAHVQDPVDIISGWLDVHINQLDLIRKLVKISLDYANSGNRINRIDMAIRDFYDHERRILTGAMRQGIANGAFRAVNVDQMANFISTFLDGVMVRSMISSDLDTVSAIHGLRDFVLNQLRPDSPTANSHNSSDPIPDLAFRAGTTP